MMFTVVLTSVLLVAASADCGSERRLFASSEVPPIVLDDVDAVGNGWSQGTSSACLEDAYHGTLHDDKSSDKGHVSGAYTFDPPKDGCYVVEEHHPGQNPHCSQRLPTNARIDVDYCKGKSAYTHVDQSLGGGQWNVIGSLPFYVGWQGKIRVANTGTGSTCALGKDCLWVADAFKVTWVSDASKACKVPEDYVGEEPSTTLTTTLTASMELQPMASTMNIVNQALDAIQTIVDDVSATTHWQRSSCGMQGWQQQFLLYQEDPLPMSPTEAAPKFIFDPPIDGCYMLEEFHPENVCGRALSSDVSLSIHYCKGLEKKVQVDQSKNGNQWNSVGIFPFYKGLPGKVVVSRTETDSAAAVADAFRFTRISSSCNDVAQASIQYHRLAQNAAAIIVDNRHHQHSASNTCSIKALGGSLHAASDGEAEAKFDFIPTSTGCYRLDSFHPENEGCMLADHAALEVNWCLGKHTKLMTPLSGRGNRWNTIGHFKFYAGTKGNVISRRVSETSNAKFWVADAFRFTKVSEACDAIPDVGHISFHITAQGLKNHLPAVLETGLTSYPDLRMALHEAVVEATELPYKSVHLLSIRKGSIIADFEVRGSSLVVADSVAKVRAQISPGTKSTLKQALCKAVVTDSKAQCDVAVMQAIVLPSPLGNKEEALEATQANENDDGILVGCIVGGIAIVVAIALLCLVKVAHRLSKKVPEGEAADVATINVMPKEVLPTKEEWDCSAEKEKPGDEESSQAGSTVTPTSTEHDCNVDLEEQSVISKE